MATVTCPKCGRTLTTDSSDGKFMFCEYCGTKININLNYNFNYSKSEHTEHIVDDAKIKDAENINRVIGIFASPFEERRKAKEEEKRQLEEAKRKLEEEARQEAEEAKRAKEVKQERKEKILRGEYSIKSVIISVIVDLFQSDDFKRIVACALLLCVPFGYLAYSGRKSSERQHQEELEALAHEKAAASRLVLGQASIPSFYSSDDARSFAKELKDSGFTNVTTEAVPDLVTGLTNKEYEIIEVLVDGAPDYDSDKWYPVDTPIVVRYHVYREGAKEAKDELIDRATNAVKGKAEDAIDKVGDKINSFLDDSSSTK